MASRTTGEKAVLFFEFLFFAILALGAVYLIVRWDDIPEQFPVHWSSRNAPNGWANRTPGDVFLPIALAAVIGGIIFAIASARFVRLPLKAALLLLAYFIGFSLAFTAVWLPFRAATAMPVGFVATVLIGVVFVNLLLLCTVGLASLDVNVTLGNPSPDRRAFYSKCGFYRNPNDPELWVPKLYGYGWTVNLAHTRGRVIAWASILAPLTIVLAAILTVIWVAFENRH